MSNNQLTFDFRDPMDVIRAWIISEGIRITGLGSLKQDGVDVTDKAGNYGMLYQWYFKAVEHENVKRLNDFKIAVATGTKKEKPNFITALGDKPLTGALFKVYIPKVLAAIRQQLAARIAFTPDIPKTIVMDFIEIITGKRQVTDECALRHWMWQVKRGILNQDATGQMMIVMVGAQGKFKSKTVELMCKPLGDFFVSSTVNDVFGSFAGKELLATAAAVLFDELDGVKRTDMLSIKNTITAKTIRARPLFSNGTVDRTLRAGMIGTSNSPIEEQLRDHTGMRRFWQINFGALTPADFEQLKTFPFIDMWRSIDESRDEGYYLDQKAAMNIVQEDMRHREHIEDFLDEYNISKAKVQAAIYNNNFVFVKSGAVHEVYAAWLKKHGQTYVLESAAFSKACKRLLGDKVLEKFYIDGIQHRGMRLNNDHQLKVEGQSIPTLEINKLFEI